MRKNTNITDIYPLSPIQLGMLFHSLYSSGSTMYFQQFYLQLEGQLDTELFKQAWQTVLDRHDILRASFVWEGVDTPVQVIKKQAKLSWHVDNWRHYNQDEQNEQFELFLESDRERGFELNRAPLMRFALFEMGAGAYQFVWSHHHLLLDGWSLPLILREVFTCYQALSNNTPLSLPKPIPYRNYLVWLQKQNQGKAKQFWQTRLQGFTKATSLIVDNKPSALVDWVADYAHKKSHLSEADTTKLQNFAKKHRLTVNTIVQGAWSLLLSRYSKEQDILFGSAVSGRPSTLERANDMIGVFINTLPIRTQIEPNQTIISWLRTLQMNLAEQDIYAYCSLADIQGWSELPQGQPLFETMVVFENYPMSTLEVPGTQLRLVDIEGFEYTNYPLTLIVAPGPELLLQLDYDTNRYDLATTRLLLQHLHALLGWIINDSYETIGELPYLPTQEATTLITKWSGKENPTTVPLEQCVHQLFEAQVKQNPQKIAVVYKEESITYEALNAKANQLANHLQTLGVGPETLVAIYIERSIEMMIGVLGILKAGAAYVPLDTAYPEERVDYILQDANIDVVLTRTGLATHFSRHANIRMVAIDNEATVAHYNTNNLNLAIDPHNLAYLIYTSGSTGRPKGVLVQHNTLSFYTQEVAHMLQLTPDDAMLQFASLCFDTSAEEIYSCLYTGGTLVLRTNEMLDSISQFFHDCEKWNVSIIDLPTAYWHEMVSQLQTQSLLWPSSIRTVLIGGERALPSVLKTWYALLGQQVELFNGYGPTEATIVTTFANYTSYQDVPLNSELSIGTPIPGAETYLLDEDLQLVPMGMVGELCVSGTGISRGYKDRPALTAQKFVPNPFGTGQRLYRTGDLARYRLDGQIEFVGRKDHQVKIRGFRVELGEIETRLAGHDNVHEAVVITQEQESGHLRLIAYATVNDTACTPTQLIHYLKTILPDYMVPSAILIVDVFARTVNGKIDHDALPKPDTFERMVDTEVIEASTSTEETLITIWRDVLKVEEIGIYDNFFELGGDSILSLQVASRASQKGLQITPRLIFQHQNIAELANNIQEKPSVQAYQGIVTGSAPLTPIQQWFFEQNWIEQHHFNQSLLIELPPHADKIKIQKVINKILLHHDALRSHFVCQDGMWQQQYAEPRNLVPLTYINLSEHEVSQHPELIKDASTQLQSSLDILQGPLQKVCLFERGDGLSSYLLWTVHHLVIDGVSWRILLEDFTRAYEQLEENKIIQLSPKTTSFKKWAKGVAQHSEANHINEGDYWLQQIPQNMPEVPVDFVDNLAGQFTQAQTAKHLTVLSQADTEALLQRSHGTYNTQINDLLLTGLSRTFYQWTGHEKLYIELEGHGREQILDSVDISRTVGWFTTLYPILLNLGHIEQIGEQIKGTKEQLRQIPNQGIEYGLLRYLSSSTELSNALAEMPTPKINFNYLGQMDQALESPLLLSMQPNWLGSDSSPQQTTPYYFEINGFVTNEQLHIEWTYIPELHSERTIERLGQQFIHELQTIVQHCQVVEQPEYTPSDFPEVDLSQGELDDLLADITA